MLVGGKGGETKVCLYEAEISLPHQNTRRRESHHYCLFVFMSLVKKRINDCSLHSPTVMFNFISVYFYSLVVIEHKIYVYLF